MTAKLLPGDPFARGTIQRLRFTVSQSAKKEPQVDGLCPIVVADRLEEFPHLHFHTKFLPQFADKALLKSLVRLAFAAGEFPKPAKMRSGVALGDQKFAGTENQTGTDFD